MRRDLTRNSPPVYGRLLLLKNQDAVSRLVHRLLFSQLKKKQVDQKTNHEWMANSEERPCAARIGRGFGSCPVSELFLRVSSVPMLTSSRNSFTCSLNARRLDRFLDQVFTYSGRRGRPLNNADVCTRLHILVCQGRSREDFHRDSQWENHEKSFHESNGCSPKVILWYPDWRTEKSVLCRVKKLYIS